jgi:hypothetical protein
MMTCSRGEYWVTVISNSPPNDAVNEPMAEVLGLVHFQQDKNSCLSRFSNAVGRWFFQFSHSTQFGLSPSKCLPNGAQIGGIEW